MLVLQGFTYERYDELANRFSTGTVPVCRMQHSLVSISKWEARYKKPFISNDEKTNEELSYYIRCMLVTKHISTEAFVEMVNKHTVQINDFINESRTATIFNNFASSKRGGHRTTVTSELIYYWMVTYNIPFEAQRWHLSRLLTLIRIFNVKGDKSTLSRAESHKFNAALNKQRRAMYES